MTKQRGISGSLWLAALLPLVLFGCTSSLHIDVAVYKGPVSGPPAARIDRALGLARASAAVAAQAVGRKAAYDDLLKDVGAHHHDLGLDGSQGQLDDQAVAARLREYAQNCQSIVRRIGYSELKAGYIPLIGGLFVDVDYLAAMIDIDENSRLIEALSDPGGSAESAGNNKEVFLADINHIIASQSPGSLMVAIRETVPFWYREKIDRIYNGVYWGEINPIEASGSGDYVAMLVKDDIGNWHLKKVEVDPEELIKTAAKLAELALKVGIPAP